MHCCPLVRLVLLALATLSLAAVTRAEDAVSAERIRTLDPPLQGFFTKELDYDGIPIKAPAVVADAALTEAHARLERLLRKLPEARHNLRVAGAELHIIGKDQVTSDLPEHRHLKGKPFDGALTVDQRTRGLGGLLTSCGEENLLRLPGDRYAGRDICIHEFSHNLQNQGLSDDVRGKIREQYRKSLDKGLWRGAYAATNEGEYFAELAMWYFGTHGDLGMAPPKPAAGPEGLRKYDPEAYALLDDLFSGRVPISRMAVAELPALGPEREKDLRSGDGKEAATIRFVNRTDQTLAFHWLDSTGQRHVYGTLPPQGRATQPTFATHVWLLAGPDERTVCLFVAVPGQCQATVR